MYNQKPPMTVRYEINPPKISGDGQDVRNVLFERIETISSVCNGIHLTDSVLGIPRVSPFKIAKQIRESNKNIKLTCSLRVRDKNLNDIEKIVQESIGTVDGILVLMGDKSDTMPNKDNLIPSQVVKALNDNGLDKKIELFLSLPSNPNFAKIQKKLMLNL
jgi:homocysteine S-methyltransferase